MSRFERFGEILASSFPLRFGQIDNEDQSGEGFGTGGPVLRVATWNFSSNDGGRDWRRQSAAERMHSKPRRNWPTLG